LQDVYKSEPAGSDILYLIAAIGIIGKKILKAPIEIIGKKYFKKLLFGVF